MTEMLQWAEHNPQFGAALPNGSCEVITPPSVCGFPLLPNGTCLNGHPARPDPATAIRGQVTGSTDTKDIHA